MIFYTNAVAMSGQEMSLMKKLEDEKGSFNLPLWWNTGDTLRFAHTVKLDLEKTKIVGF